MAKITGFGDAFRTLAAESGTMRGHPMMSTAMYYACESDEQAAVLQGDAAQDAADMVADIEVADTSDALASQADLAGDVFAAAATDESVPEGSIAQADAVAMDVADETGMAVQELLPDITDTDRVAQVPASESANGRVTFRPMYGRIRKDKAGLRRCAESMWTSAKALVSNAWESILKAFRKFCQWVEKYIGTFPRLKMKVDSLLKDVKNLDGKKIKSGENKITVAAKNLAMPAADSAEVSYIDDGAKLIAVVTGLRKAVDDVVEEQRSLYDDLTDYADLLNGADFSDDAEIEKFLKASQDDSREGMKNFTSTARKGHAMPKHDTAYAKAYSVDTLPGYQRILYMVGQGAKTDPKDINAGLESAISKYNGYDVKIVDGDPDLKKTLKPDVQFKTMDGNEIEQLATELKKGLEEIIAYRSSKQYLKSEEAIKKAKEAAEKVESRKNNTDSEDVSKGGRLGAKAAVALARLNMRALAAPTRLVTYFDTYTNFCITLARKCIATYETR